MTILFVLYHESESVVNVRLKKAVGITKNKIDNLRKHMI